MRKFGYIRATKLHLEAEQRAALAHIAPDNLCVDEKPKRGEPGWYWLDKAIGFCRVGREDEIHVSHASVLGSTPADALGRLKAITARGATLVVAATGGRYQWHPDAEAGLALALEIAAEARAEMQRKATRASSAKAVRERRAKAEHWKRTKKRWFEEIDTPGDVIAREQGYSRAHLNKMLGPRGTPRFGGKKEPT